MNKTAVVWWESLIVTAVSIVGDWAILRWIFGVSNHHAAIIAWVVAGLYVPLWRIERRLKTIR